MQVLHIKHFRRRLTLLGAAAAVVLSAAFVLAGCLGHGKQTDAPILLEDIRQQVEYLNQLGWQVNPEPLETLTLQLPHALSESFAEYMALQEEQGLPFSRYGGQEVQRYTYAVLNYPGYAGNVQVNLFLCNGHLIGGDVIAMGENGFMRGLSFPGEA